MIPNLKALFFYFISFLQKITLSSLKKVLSNWILIYFTIAYLSYIIWLRVLRERPFKVIPFEITWMGFIFLLFICLLYTYAIMKIIFNWKGNNSFIYKFINIIYEPLLILEKRFLQSESYKTTYINLCVYIYEKIKNFLNIKNIILAYIIINIFPRTLLGIFLAADVFIYEKISNFYKYAFLTLIILLGKIFIHTFEQLKELCILKVESMSEPEGFFTDYLTPEEEAEPLDEEELYMLYAFNEPRIKRKIYRKIVEIQTFAQLFENKQYWVVPSVSLEYWKEFQRKNNIDIEIEGYLYSPQWHRDYHKINADMNRFYPLGIEVSIFLFRYNYCVNSLNVKGLQLFTNILFLISWSRILYINVVISKLGLMEKIIVIVLSIENIPVNPFA